MQKKFITNCNNNGKPLVLNQTVEKRLLKKNAVKFVFDCKINFKKNLDMLFKNIRFYKNKNIL